MTTLRNIAIGLIRQAGHGSVAPVIRKIRHSPALLLRASRTHHDRHKRLCGPPWPLGKFRRLDLYSQRTRSVTLSIGYCGCVPTIPGSAGRTCFGHRSRPATTSGRKVE